MPVRPSLRGAALLAATVLVAGCGSGDAGSSGDAAASSSPAGSGGAFPVTVETAFGDVEIPEEPQRVVALGWSDAETALALGVQPVGASDWLAFGGEGVGPWAEGRYDEAPEIIETLEPSLEASPRCSPTSSWTPAPPPRRSATTRSAPSRRPSASPRAWART
jgi:iron complex transport system substrate-binding protein